MCVAVGIGPAEVLELDAPMFDALELEAAERARWSPELELAASQLEVAHGQLVAFLAVHSKKGAKLPEPLRIDRPTSTSSSSTPAGSRPAGAAAFARMFAPRVAGATGDA